MYFEVHDEPSPSNVVQVSRTHEAIAMGPTGNLQGSVKFYCLNTGRILKRRSFTPCSIPDWIIKRANQIKAREKQGHSFRFLNCRAAPFEWTDEVPENNAEFQGLLEEEEPTPYPDVSIELPGVELEYEEPDFEVVMDKPEPDFCKLAAAALNNAGIDLVNRLCAARDVAVAKAATRSKPTLVEANNDKIMYEITFDLPNAGLGVVPPDAPPPLTDDAGISNMVHAMVDMLTEMTAAMLATMGKRYLSRYCRSVVRHRPYNS